eukprot:280777-Prymnesium_polylepis.1
MGAVSSSLGACLPSCLPDGFANRAPYRVLDAGAECDAHGASMLSREQRVATAIEAAHRGHVQRKTGSKLPNIASGSPGDAPAGRHGGAPRMSAVTAAGCRVR